MNKSDLWPMLQDNTFIVVQNVIFLVIFYRSYAKIRTTVSQDHDSATSHCQPPGVTTPLHKWTGHPMLHVRAPVFCAPFSNQSYVFILVLAKLSPHGNSINRSFARRQALWSPRNNQSKGRADSIPLVVITWARAIKQCRGACWKSVCAICNCHISKNFHCSALSLTVFAKMANDNTRTGWFTPTDRQSCGGLCTRLAVLRSRVFGHTAPTHGCTMPERAIVSRRTYLVTLGPRLCFVFCYFLFFCFSCSVAMFCLYCESSLILGRLFVVSYHSFVEAA